MASIFKPLIGGIGVQTITSCSSGSDDPPDGGGGGGNGKGEGMTNTYDIENLDEANHSFKIIYKSYDCQENGTMEEYTKSEAASYSISGTTLSFEGAEFSGNSASLIGTWTREPFTCVEKECSYNAVSKAVFMLNSITITNCVGKPGEIYEYEKGGVAVKYKIIDCGTAEETRGTQTVRATYSGTEISGTYKGKTCKFPSSSSSYPKEQREKACTDAYSKVIKENPGYYGSGYHYLVENAYYEILYKELDDCLKRNNFPEWFRQKGCIS